MCHSAAVTATIFDLASLYLTWSNDCRVSTLALNYSISMNLFLSCWKKSGNLVWSGVWSPCVHWQLLICINETFSSYTSYHVVDCRNMILTSVQWRRSVDMIRWVCFGDYLLSMNWDVKVSCVIKYSWELLHENWKDLLIMKLGKQSCGRSYSKAEFTLIRVRVQVSLHVLASVALYSRQCYILCMLHYVRHNADVIIDLTYLE